MYRKNKWSSSSSKLNSSLSLSMYSRSSGVLRMYSSCSNVRLDSSAGACFDRAVRGDRFMYPPSDRLIDAHFVRKDDNQKNCKERESDELQINPRSAKL